MLDVATNKQPSEMSQILIIDDDLAVSGLLFEVLRNAGYEVQNAKDGQKALNALREMQTLPSLILLDLVMPVMNGWQFRRAQLQDPRLASVPVVVLSGTVTFESDISELRASGYLRKPVSVEKLLDLVKRICPPRAFQSARAGHRTRE
jgi:CheY-like chemotaxis protein